MLVFETCSSAPGTNVCRLRLKREPKFSILGFSRIWVQDCPLDNEGRRWNWEVGSRDAEPWSLQIHKHEAGRFDLLLIWTIRG